MTNLLQPAGRGESSSTPDLDGPRPAVEAHGVRWPLSARTLGAVAGAVVVAVGLASTAACAPEPPAQESAPERPAPPLGQLHVLQCDFDQGPLFDDSPPYQWRLLVNREGVARLYEFESGILRERVAECDSATFQHLAAALEAAQLTRNREYLPTPSDGFHPPCWSISASTSTGEWSVLAFTKRPPAEVAAVQEALAAFKRDAQWRDA